MKKFEAILLITICLSAHLNGDEVRYIKSNVAANCGAAVGRGLAEGFNQSFTDVIMRQRDLEQYESMLDIQYRHQLRVKALDEECLRYLEEI